MPFLSQVAASVSSIGREASLTSVFPSQKRANPSPVPGPSTLICTSGFFEENFSATSEEIGWTVEDPETTTEPVNPPLPPLPEPLPLPLAFEQAEPRSDRAENAATAAHLVVLLIMPPCRRNPRPEARRQEWPLCGKQVNGG